MAECKIVSCGDVPGVESADDDAYTIPTPPRRGCLNPSATNFDPDAVEDDGSCTFS